jgi:hypothetical protein
MMTLYFAYGSNLNIAHMKARCPAAKPIGKLELDNSALVFRGVADCIYQDGAKTWGGVWKITPECERTLDIYEGVARGFYRKELMPITGLYKDEEHLMLYVMNSTGIFPPSQDYLDTIIEGYRDFDLPVNGLKAAVKASWKEKNPSHLERHRYRRNGRPQLGVSRTVCK